MSEPTSQPNPNPNPSGEPRCRGPPRRVCFWCRDVCDRSAVSQGSSTVSIVMTVAYVVAVVVDEPNEAMGS